MNRNQKIALGCGGAGCLGVIAVVIVVVGLSAAGYLSSPGKSSDNRNRNYNSNDNSTANQNSNSDSSRPSSTMSNDDKHKLFQAVNATKDDQLLLKVLARIGFPNGTGEGYDQFLEEHINWAFKNFDFIESVDTAEKGRAYVEAHLDD
jgi:hypothetical protein